MEPAIIIVIVVVVLVIIAVAILFLQKGGRSYARMADKQLREEGIDLNPKPAPAEKPPRVPRVQNPDAAEDSSMTSLIINTVRAVGGLVALGILIYIFKSTQDAAAAVTDAALKTSVYTGGIFKAVVTAGAAGALYIFTKFSK